MTAANAITVVLAHARAGALEVSERQEKLLRAPAGVIDLSRTPSVASALSRMVVALLELPATGEVEEAVVEVAGSGTVFAGLIHDVLAATPDPKPEPASAPEAAPASEAEVVVTGVAPDPEPVAAPQAPDDAPAALAAWSAPVPAPTGRTLLDALTDNGGVVEVETLALEKPKGVQVAPVAQLRAAPGAKPARRRFGR